MQKSFIEYTDSMLGEIVFSVRIKIEVFSIPGRGGRRIAGERLFKILHEKMF